jgi:hypothetical protein
LLLQLFSNGKTGLPSHYWLQGPNRVSSVKNGSRAVDHFEYPKIPITSEDVRGVLREIGREISSSKEDQLLWWLNVVKLDLETFSLQEPQRLRKLEVALENVWMELDPLDNDALVRAGEKFAEKNGSLLESQGMPVDGDFEEVGPEIFAYGSFEKIETLRNQISEVRDWLSLVAETGPLATRRNSFQVRVIGEDLPRIYEMIFGVKFTASVDGPGPSFIQAVQKKMPEYLPKHSPETIIKYCQRMRDRKSGKSHPGQESKKQSEK